MRRLFLFGLCSVFALVACQPSDMEPTVPSVVVVPTLEIAAEVTIEPTAVLEELVSELGQLATEPKPTAAVEATRTIEASPTATSTVVATEPTAVPATAIPDGPPEFDNIRFATAPNGEPQTIFPPGTQEIYALWDYERMTGETHMRRKWSWPSESFERDEIWNVAAEGANGTVDDIFIYDYESEQGLDAGLYSFDLFIDGLWAGTASFYVHGVEAVADPVSGRLAYVDDVSTLVVEEADGAVLATLNGFEFENLMWLQDGRYLMYREVDRREYAQLRMPWTIVSHSWLLNLETGAVSLLGGPLRAEQFSSDMRYVAAERGSGFADACGVDLVWQFSVLNENGVVVAEYEPSDFAGFPDDWIASYYPDGGYWESETAFVANLPVLCDPIEMTGEAGDSVEKNRGIYRFSLDTLQAERIGDLPVVSDE